jgi:GTP-binding protein EngB required for normal cell division
LQNKQHNFRHYTVGEDIGMAKPFKTVMMVGMTGAGKSLMLNNMVNYIYGVIFQDNFRFKLIHEDDEISERHSTGDSSTSQADSMTRWVSSYTLHYKEGSRVPYTLILIDTPGFGDTRGINFDENIGKNLKEFFSNKTYPINELSSIGLVIQSSQARLTAEQMYVFNAVLNIFGKNVVKNICLLFTFADAQPPSALATVRKEKIPFPEEGVFKFNNSAVYAGINNESNSYYWKFGFDSLKDFFLHIQVVEPASLTLTKEVLKERETLHLHLDSLQKWINDGFEALQSIENTTRIVMELKGTMRANKDFKVKKTVHPQETQKVGHFITNCLPCMYTCHSPCAIEGDVKKGCASMKDGKCVNCPGKCSWESHSNGNQ